MLPKAIGTKYLDINPEGALPKEAQDIAEELKIMKRIYNEQLKVVKDFKRHLAHPRGRRTDKADSVGRLQKLLQGLIGSRDKQEEGEGEEEEDDGTDTPKRKHGQYTAQIADETLHEAEGVLELARSSRRAEIVELEQSALHTCRQLEGFLTLKQQQASIVEAKAALERAGESVKQGRAIMAFTIITIFFLPLGSFAAFFGMNNDDINEAKWMRLNDQIKWMFSLSTVVIVLSTSIAFYPSMRPFLIPIVKPSLAVCDIL
ncbi:CorA-like Mg2+ transporter protein [Apiospora aurea]|uniref:CorA-like Mg2+ transporter protein n=1 Tax=Apiospora aurea TaxID=335848 RepID=A0ABR1Q5D0_9PEZI